MIRSFIQHPRSDKIKYCRDVDNGKRIYYISIAAKLSRLPAGELVIEIDDELVLISSFEAKFLFERRMPHGSYAQAIS
jgi:hypothetical protein